MQRSMPGEIRSPALEALYVEAQSQEKRPIIVVWMKATAADFYQGFTDFSDPKQVRIEVTRGVSRGHDEAVLAHELFHVILHNKGFGARIGTTKSSTSAMVSLRESRRRALKLPEQRLGLAIRTP